MPVTTQMTCSKCKGAKFAANGGACLKCYGYDVFKVELTDEEKKKYRIGMIRVETKYVNAKAKKAK